MIRFVDGDSPASVTEPVTKQSQDTRMTRDQYEALMNSPSGGQAAMYRSASLTDTLKPKGGRPPKGARPMTGAERVKAHRERKGKR